MDHVDAEHRISRRDRPIRVGYIEEDRRSQILRTLKTTIGLDTGKCAFVDVGRSPGNARKGHRKVTRMFATSASYFKNRARRRKDLF